MSDNGVAAVERALAILDCFDGDRPTLSLKEIAERTGLYKSTILRLCISLERFGYIGKLDDGSYQLGSTLWRLGTLYRSRFDLSHYVRPVLERLVEATGESASYYVRDGDSRICLIRRNSTRAIRLHLDEGSRLPLTIGAAGHVIVAYTDGTGPESDRIRARGHAISVGERDPDAASIAVPVLQHEGSFAGALVVSGLRTRFDESARASALTLAKKEAATLATVIAG
ncbi:MAG: IclR family transcriptional regulator [Pseudomonadota bacterium]